MKGFTLIIMGLVLTLFLSTCGEESAIPGTGIVDLSNEAQVITVAAGSYTNVSPAGLAQMLEDKDFPLINVHIPYEGEIDGTDEFVPFNEIEANLGRFPTDKDKRVVV